MYAAVPPPKDASTEVNGDGTEGPPREVSEETWKKFQELRERRISCCKASTDKRIKNIKRNIKKTVLENFKTDEDIAVLRDEGIVHLTNNCSQNQVSKKHARKDMKKSSEERWSELQGYFNPNPQPSDASTSKEVTPRDIIEKRLDLALQKKKFDVAEELNEQLVQCDFAVKVAHALERRDYIKRKSAEQDKAKKKKKSKPYWAFEQKHRWESKGNM